MWYARNIQVHGADGVLEVWLAWNDEGKYPEQFIAVSVHGGDPLEIDEKQEYSYKPFISSCTGAPSCSLNRKLSGDPYYDIQNLFNMETSSDSQIAYSLTGEWNEDSTAITYNLFTILPLTSNHRSTISPTQ